MSIIKDLEKELKNTIKESGYELGFKECQNFVVSVFAESVVGDVHIAGFAPYPQVAASYAVVVVGDVAVFECDVAAHAQIEVGEDGIVGVTVHTADVHLVGMVDFHAKHGCVFPPDAFVLLEVDSHIVN